MARMICKASPSIVLPLALRAIGASNNSTTLNRTISASRQQRDGSLHQSHSFASAATDKDLVDASLYKLLKREMKSVKFILNNSQVNNLPDSFPYKIGEFYAPYDHRNFVLERKFGDDAETITVIINMCNVHISRNDINSEDDTSKKDIKAPVVPMIVRFQKLDKTDHLNFFITVSTEDTIIQSISKYLPYGGSWDSTGVPKLKEMNIEVQQALYKYLEIRGINSSIVSFLLKYIAVENNKYYLHVLKDLVEFIEN